MTPPDIMATEEGKKAQQSLTGMLELLAPYLPKPDTHSLPPAKPWSSSKELTAKTTEEQRRRNLTACLG